MYVGENMFWSRTFQNHSVDWIWVWFKRWVCRDNDEALNDIFFPAFWTATSLWQFNGSMDHRHQRERDQGVDLGTTWAHSVEDENPLETPREWQFPTVSRPLGTSAGWWWHIHEDLQKRSIIILYPIISDTSQWYCFALSILLSLQLIGLVQGQFRGNHRGPVDGYEILHHLWFLEALWKSWDKHG